MKTILSLLLICTIAFSQKAIAVVKKAKGSVTISHNGKDKKVKRGTRIYHDDKLSTGKKSLVAFVFLDDKSLVRVRQNSIFKVKGEREQNNIAKNIVMEIGDVFASVAKQKGRFRVESPTSVASVKGTEFSVEFNNGISTTYVFEGSVEVSSKKGGKSETLGEGEKASADGDGNLNKSAMTEADKNKKNDDLGDIPTEVIFNLENDKGEKKQLNIKVQGN